MKIYRKKLLFHTKTRRTVNIMRIAIINSKERIAA